MEILHVQANTRAKRNICAYFLAIKLKWKCYFDEFSSFAAMEVLKMTTLPFQGMCLTKRRTLTYTEVPYQLWNWAVRCAVLLQESL